MATPPPPLAPPPPAEGGAASPSLGSRAGHLLWCDRSRRGKAGVVAAALVLLLAPGWGGDEEDATTIASAPAASSITLAEVEPAVPTTVGTTTTTRAPTTTTEAPTTTTTAPTTTTAAMLTVTDVVDGDTLDLSDGTRIRLIGIDTPERGDCGYREAATALEGLVGGKSVTLVAGARDDVDGYGRLLRYVEVDGVDANLEMIRSGRAISRYDSRDGYGRHDREDAYVAADAAAASANVCATPTTAPPPPPLPPPPSPQAASPGQGCNPNYDPCVPVTSDVDCAGGSGNGPAYVQGPVRVIGQDVYGLDGNDNDGWGCE